MIFLTDIINKFDIDKPARIVGDKVDVGADEVDQSAGFIFPIDNSPITIYQNSTNHELIIALDVQAENLSCKLFNLSGQCFFNQTYHQVSQIIERPSIFTSSGIYIFEIMKDGVLQKGKICILRS